MVGSVKFTTIESLDKKLHELSMKQFVVDAVKDATPRPQSATVFAQTSQKGNEQNKKKPTNNVDGG